ncbi:pentapeptide repeat-containing protein [Amycolatopsis pithecellobii]|uniref:Pentapeptide repeat-containing protein n=1 Tax=Amycolatopsis pithecellobii TaxID=664692 RepID=A0A6N7Z8J2_9PSEU|nr:pentapeptide repeat-containing protein [Amycolatopsis pithecellobii]MTD58054.1 hypothetical protein [Amycolatopsis pithecellobii]
MRGRRSPLLATFVLSVVLLAGVTGWLLTDPATTRADALRTGGLAGGSVVALYALWLNDRRRKVEENRQQVERERYELELLRAERDRERTTDERFAKSVELLGNEADQVRVGALHALVGLARSRPDYRQTVLDILCAYLRMPSTKDEPEIQRTAQRLLVELLPAAGTGEAYDLDLTGADLRYFDPAGRRVGTLVLRDARLNASTNLSGCEFTGPVWFTRAIASGRFVCREAKFGERAWFSGTTFESEADFTDSTFRGQANFKKAVFSGDAVLDATFLDALDLRETRFDGQVELHSIGPSNAVSLYNTLVNPARAKLPAHWSAEHLDGHTRIVDGRG